MIAKVEVYKILNNEIKIKHRAPTNNESINKQRINNNNNNNTTVCERTATKANGG